MYVKTVSHPNQSICTIQHVPIYVLAVCGTSCLTLFSVPPAAAMLIQYTMNISRMERDRLKWTRWTWSESRCLLHRMWRQLELTRQCRDFILSIANSTHTTFTDCDYHSYCILVNAGIQDKWPTERVNHKRMKHLHAVTCYMEGTSTIDKSIPYCCKEQQYW